MNKFLSDPRHRFDTTAPYRQAPTRAAVEAPLSPEQSAAIESWRRSTPVGQVLRLGAVRVQCVRPGAGWAK